MSNDPTVTTDLQIKLTWPKPFDGGIPELEYDIYYDQSNGNWVTLVTGVTDLYYVTTTQLIPGNTFTFKAISRQWYGESIEGPEVSILAAKEPDAPINFVNIPGITTAYLIGVEWNDGAYDGATPVIDYELSYAEQSDSEYTVFAPSLTSRIDIIPSLTPGKTYKFIVRSRNVINYSEYSNELLVVAAQVPDNPTGLQNVPEQTHANQIGLSWSAPVFIGGSEILGYQIWYDNASG